MLGAKHNGIFILGNKASSRVPTLGNKMRTTKVIQHDIINDLNHKYPDNQHSNPKGSLEKK